MDLGLVGKRALVMAGTRGLGLACASALAGEGVKVTLVGRDGDIGRAAAGTVGSGASFIQGDLSNPDFRAQLPKPSIFRIIGIVYFGLLAAIHLTSDAPIYGEYFDC